MITHLQLVDELLIASIIAIWLGTIRWAYTDARARIRSRALVRCATAVTAVPVVGLIIYLTVRPPDRLSELRQVEMELRALEVRLRRMGRRRCPECDYELLSGFLRCPRCTAPLRQPCVRCRRPLELSWATCPFCDADQTDPAAAAAGAGDEAEFTATDLRPAAHPQARPGGARRAGPPRPPIDSREWSSGGPRGAAAGRAGGRVSGPGRPAPITVRRVSGPAGGGRLRPLPGGSGRSDQVPGESDPLGQVPGGSGQLRRVPSGGDRLQQVPGGLQQLPSGERVGPPGPAPPAPAGEAQTPSSPNRPTISPA